jgi:hypothetical protein
VKGWLPFTSQRGLNQVLFEPCKMVAHHTALQPKLPISWWIPSLSSKKRLILCKQASKQASKQAPHAVHLLLSADQAAMLLEPLLPHDENRFFGR